MTRTIFSQMRWSDVEPGTTITFEMIPQKTCRLAQISWAGRRDGLFVVEARVGVQSVMSLDEWSSGGVQVDAFSRDVARWPERIVPGALVYMRLVWRGPARATLSLVVTGAYVPDEAL